MLNQKKVNLLGKGSFGRVEEISNHKISFVNKKLINGVHLDTELDEFKQNIDKMLRLLVCNAVYLNISKYSKMLKKFGLLRREDDSKEDDLHFWLEFKSFKNRHH